MTTLEKIKKYCQEIIDIQTDEDEEITKRTASRKITQYHEANIATCRRDKKKAFIKMLKEIAKLNGE